MKNIHDMRRAESFLLTCNVTKNYFVTLFFISLRYVIRYVTVFNFPLRYCVTLHNFFVTLFFISLRYVIRYVTVFNFPLRYCVTLHNFFFTLRFSVTLRFGYKSLYKTDKNTIIFVISLVLFVILLILFVISLLKQQSTHLPAMKVVISPENF
jgi:hypothetical protein